ncbi:MAG: hypothetical protein JXQ79_01715 [Rhodobacteraceae bacterium]|nr:hypothetical protein [Paracoccaceae bacterium]
MSSARLDRLAQLADLLHARDMAKLGRLVQAREQWAARIAALPTRLEMTENPALNAARLAHAKWAQAQRIGLTQKLARHTASMHEQKAVAARSLGRSMALDKLRKSAR